MDIHNKIILCKTCSFMICSPIDTLRQNKLVNMKLTKSKLLKSIGYGGLSALCMSTTCQKSIEFCEKHKFNYILSVSLAVLLTSMVKVPLVYNYKRIQIGLKPMLPPLSNSKSIFKLNIIEDIVEEGYKYHLVKNNSKNPLFDSMVIFSLSYPFDIMKNRTILKDSINGSVKDFAHKAVYKNVQNLSFLNMIKLV